jgi:WD40 repeat protein
MGVVYRAREVALNRPVALKMVLAGPYADPATRARFLLEAESVASVRHPHVVQVYAFGEHAGHPYLALEYLPGGTLADRVRVSGPVPPTEAAVLAARLADAAAAAHAAGVIHRDLKPSNVLLTAAGAPKVTDFGLAKVSRSDMTATGAVLGTPSYMAPEQAAGKTREVGTAADVYGLGAILYDLLTGHPPFKGDSQAVTIQLVLTADPLRPRTLNAAVPRDLETVCLKCLEKAPAARYPTAAALADDLRRFLAGEPVSARPVGRTERVWRWCRRNPALAVAQAVATALLVAVAVVSGAASVRERELRGQAESALEKAESAAKVATAATDDAVQKAGELSRQKRVADDRLRALQREAVNLSYTQGLSLCENGDAAHGLLWLTRGYEQAGAAGLPDLRATGRTLLDGWSRDVHRLRLVLPVESTSQVVVTGDGKVIVTAGAGRGEVRRWDAVTGKPIGEPFVHGAGVRSLAVSADGSVIFSGGIDGIGRLWNEATGQQLPAEIRHVGPITGAALSPDGRWLVTGGGLEDRLTKLWDVKAGKLIGQPVRHGHRIQGLAFSPDGKTFLTAGWDRRVQVWSSGTGGAIGPPLTLFGLPQAVSFSPDGRKFAVGTTRGEVSIWDAQGKQPAGLVFKHTAGVDSLTFSPDGRYLLTGSADGTARLWDIETGYPVGAPIRHRSIVTGVGVTPSGALVTGGPGSPVRVWERARMWPHTDLRRSEVTVSGAALSPDGRLALTVENTQTLGIWEAVTGRQAASAIDLPAVATNIAYSPDGRWVALGCRDNRVYLVDTRAWARTPFILDTASVVLSFSPDGGMLLTAGSGEAGGRMWEVPSGRPLGQSLYHPRGIRAAAFSPDGTRVLTGGNDNTVRVWDARTGTPVGAPVALGAAGKVVGFSPDGARVAVGSGRVVTLWNFGAGLQEGPKTLAHPAEVMSLVFSPDGQTLLTGCDGGTARLWNVASGEPIGPPLRHGGAVASVLFTPGGVIAVTGSKDGTVRTWDVLSGRAAGPPALVLGQVKRMWLSPDGRRLLMLPDNGSYARVWDLADQISAGADWTVTAAEALTGMELDASGTVNQLSQQDWAKRREAAPAFLAPGATRPAEVVAEPLSVFPFSGRAPLHAHAVQQVAYLPDGRLVSAAHDGAVGVWSLDGRGRRVTVGDGRDGVAALALIRDGRILAGTSTGAVILVPLGTGPARR